MWLVELKSSSFKASVLHRKFENGVEQALNILERAGFRGRPTLEMVLLAKAYKSRSERLKISRVQAKILGKNLHIHMCRCGDRLQAVGT